MLYLLFLNRLSDRFREFGKLVLSIGVLGVTNAVFLDIIFNIKITTLTRAWLKYDWLFPATNIQGIVYLYGTRIQKFRIYDRLLILNLQCSRH